MMEKKPCLVQKTKYGSRTVEVLDTHYNLARPYVVVIRDTRGVSNPLIRGSSSREGTISGRPAPYGGLSTAREAGQNSVDAYFRLQRWTKLE
jgi:hypothetical protein